MSTTQDSPTTIGTTINDGVVTVERRSGWRFCLDGVIAGHNGTRKFPTRADAIIAALHFVPPHRLNDTTRTEVETAGITPLMHRSLWASVR